MYTFVVKLIKNIGFSLSSSRYLTRKMVSLVSKKNLGHIVELGAGYGPLSDELIKSLPSTIRIDLVEIEEKAVMHLRQKFGHLSHVRIFHMSAAHLEEIFQIESVDVIISTLPLGSISTEGVQHILKSIFSVLRKGGQYIQYQYWMANKNDIRQLFHIRKIHFEPRNFTPAFIYNAEKRGAKI